MTTLFKTSPNTAYAMMLPVHVSFIVTILISSHAQSPTFTPTSSPLSTCIDYNAGYSTVDGADIVPDPWDYLSMVDVSNEIWCDNPSICANTTFVMDSINYITGGILNCQSINACYGSIVHCNHTTLGCVIACNFEGACRGMTIYANHDRTNPINITIFCGFGVGNECELLRVYAKHIASVQVHCAGRESCKDALIQIDQSGHLPNTLVGCYVATACTGLTVEADSAYVQLMMFDYSENVTLNNGRGWYNSLNTVTCGLDHKYIRYEGGSNTPLELLVDAEFYNNTFACDGVKIICSFDNVNNKTDWTATEPACLMQKYPLPESLEGINPDECVYIWLPDIVQLQCKDRDGYFVCGQDPTKEPTPAPTWYPTSPPSNAPTFAPSEAPSAVSVPTPSPILTNKEVYVRSNGCDSGYCSSQSIVNPCSNTTTACRSIEYSWDCFHGSAVCEQVGLNGNGVLDLGNGVWDFPYNLNYDNDNIIIRGQGPSNTIWRYTGSESTWIQCRWYKCWLSLQDLTIASNRTSANDIQFHMYNGGTLYFKNVVFDGNNYVNNENGPFWIFNEYRVNVIFEDCHFTNNRAIYYLINGVTVTFTNCTWEQNEIYFVVRGSNLIIDSCIFSNFTNAPFVLDTSSIMSITDTSFIITTPATLFPVFNVNITVSLSDSIFYDIYNGSVVDATSLFSFTNLNNKINTQITIKPCTIYQPIFPNTSHNISGSALLHVFGTPGQSVDQSVLCSDSTPSCGIRCNNSVSCFLTSLEIRSNATIISCESLYSCGSSTIATNISSNDSASSLSIICDAESSCTEATMNIDKVQYVNIDCINAKACFDAKIHITNSVEAAIRCH